MLKQVATSALIVALAGLTSACSAVVGSGDLITIDVPIEDVSRLEVSHAFDLQVELSGASDAEGSVSESLTADVSGASSLRYRGDPGVTNVESSGASTISQIRPG